LPYFLSIQVHRASRRPAQATDQAQQEAGAVAGRIQDGYELTPFDLQAEPPQDLPRPFDRAPLDYARGRQDRPLADGIRLAQVKNLQDGFGLIVELFPDNIQDVPFPFDFTQGGAQDRPNDFPSATLRTGLGRCKPSVVIFQLGLFRESPKFPG
jgi:hypothetical protein